MVIGESLAKTHDVLRSGWDVLVFSSWTFFGHAFFGVRSYCSKLMKTHVDGVVPERDFFPFSSETYMGNRTKMGRTLVQVWPRLGVFLICKKKKKKGNVIQNFSIECLPKVVLTAVAPHEQYHPGQNNWDNRVHLGTGVCSLEHAGCSLACVVFSILFGQGSSFILSMVWTVENCLKFLAKIRCFLSFIHCSQFLVAMFAVDVFTHFFILCTAVDCGDPGAPVSGTRQLPDGTTIGSKITWSCDSGTIAANKSSAVCMPSGRWSSPVPVCGSKLFVKIPPVI